MLFAEKARQVGRDCIGKLLDLRTVGFEDVAILGVGSDVTFTQSSREPIHQQVPLVFGHLDAREPSR